MKLSQAKPLLALLCLFILSTCTLAQPPLETVPEASERLHQILQREWDFLLSQEPTLAMALGKSTDKLWPDRSRAARGKMAQRLEGVLEELQSLDRSQLTAAEQTNLRLFIEQLEWHLEARKLGLDLFIINQREGHHTLSRLTDYQTFSSVEDLEFWVQRLETFRDFTELEISVLQEGIERQRVHPIGIVERIIDRVQVQVQACAEPEDSSFFAPFREASESIRSHPQFSVLAQRAQSAISGPIRQSYQDLATFLAGPYSEAAPDKVGLSQLPESEEAYSYLIKRYTTTTYTAEEIHQIGLSEVASIRREMEEVKKQVGFEGSLEEFFEHLRTDPKFVTRDPEELLRRYRAFCKKVDGQMPKFFGRLARLPYGVEPIPAEIAPATTTAYYMPGTGQKAGTYCVNLYQPESRPLFEIPALSLHEAVPGHHHQIALAQELDDLPSFRRYSTGFGDYTVFVEGWALYAESLGSEMGLYEDPYDYFGRLTYDMWRSIRLVVDTGIHQLGWTRQEAIDYFLANSPRAELDVVNEIDRYIAWPGQALAYKIGELKIQELRKRAEEALGPNFDLRAFHDAVLIEGAVPLSQVERQVEAFIEEHRFP